MDTPLAKIAHSHKAQVITGAAVAVYLAMAVAYLDRFPIVGQDEPWIAAPAYKLATEGVLGSDLFAGYHGMERHHFVHMPVYPLLQAAIFYLFGIGVVQMRVLSVAFGLALLLVVYAVGRKLGGERAGALAVIIMVAVRLAAPTDIRPLGILLLDGARINRYDIAVPAFGLASVWVVLCTAGRSRPALIALAGGLAGLSGLSHLYGAFWLPALVLMVAVRDGLRRSTLRTVMVLVTGFALVWLPWLLWIGSNWSEYVAQMRTVRPRFDVFSPKFYIASIVFGDGPISLRWLARTLRGLPIDRVGAWTLALGTPTGLFLMWRRRGERTSAKTMLTVAGSVQFVLFVALMQVKSFNYVIAIWPLGALLLAWLACELWDQRTPAIRAGLAVLAVAVLIEGGARVGAAANQARSISSYDWYEAQIADCIPPGSLVLGFQHYWLGLRRFPFRTWLLPFNLSNPDVEVEPMLLDVALDQIDPDIILIDRHARELFAETANPSHRYHYLSVGFDAFRARRTLVPRCAVRDPSYGTMEIYEIAKRGGP